MLLCYDRQGSHDMYKAARLVSKGKRGGAQRVNMHSRKEACELRVWIDAQLIHRRTTSRMRTGSSRRRQSWTA